MARLNLASLTAWTKRKPTERSADTDPRLIGARVTLDDTQNDPHGDRLGGYLNTGGRSQQLADPIATPLAIDRRFTVGPAEPGFEPSHLDSMPPFLRVNSPDPLVTQLAPIGYVEPHTAQAQVLPSGRVPGVEQAGHRIPRRIPEFEVVRPAGSAWKPNNGKVMTTRGPLADLASYWPSTPADWYPNGTSITPSLAPMTVPTRPVQAHQPLTPWETWANNPGGQQ